MEYVLLVTIFVGFVSAAILLLSQTELWQRKEYRFDRVWVERKNRNIVEGCRVYVLVGLITVAGWFLKKEIIFTGAMIIYSGFLVYRIYRRGILRPRFTKKALVMLAELLLATSMLAILLLLSGKNIAGKVALLVLMIPALAILASGGANLIANWKKRETIVQAIKLRARLRGLQVIGVTGSCGKTTTKHFLKQLLTEAKVSKEHRNSEFVIATDMVEQLSETTKQYVVEMSAYKKGEIADLGRITRPDIGIITNIGNQHLGLFGSRQNILSAKWELIDCLSKDGVAVLNYDDKLIREKSNCFEGKVVWFSNRAGKADVFADNVRVEPTRLNFELIIGRKRQKVRVALASRAGLANLLAATAGAYASGIGVEQIYERVEKLKPFPRTMEVVTNKDRMTIVDDSYSANEQAVLNAIEHMKYFKQRDKRVVLVPIIELGEAAEEVHHNIGEALKLFDGEVYIYGREYEKQLGIKAINDPSELVKSVTRGLSEDSVVLLEGRVPSVLREALGLS